MGAQAAIAIPPQLLGREPSHALHEGPFDLPEIDRRVERAAAILKQLNPQHAVLAGQGIDRDFRGRCAIHEIEERPSGVRRGIPVYFGRAVIARG